MDGRECVDDWFVNVLKVCPRTQDYPEAIRGFFAPGQSDSSWAAAAPQLSPSQSPPAPQLSPSQSPPPLTDSAASHPEPARLPTRSTHRPGMQPVIRAPQLRECSPSQHKEASAPIDTGMAGTQKSRDLLAPSPDSPRDDSRSEMALLFCSFMDGRDSSDCDRLVGMARGHRSTSDPDNTRIRTQHRQDTRRHSVGITAPQVRMTRNVSSLRALTHTHPGWQTGNALLRARYLAECLTRNEPSRTGPQHHVKHSTNALARHQPSKPITCYNGELTLPGMSETQIRISPNTSHRPFPRPNTSHRPFPRPNTSHRPFPRPNALRPRSAPARELRGEVGGSWGAVTGHTATWLAVMWVTSRKHARPTTTIMTRRRYPGVCAMKRSLASHDYGGGPT